MIQLQRDHGPQPYLDTVRGNGQPAAGKVHFKEVRLMMLAAACGARIAAHCHGKPCLQECGGQLFDSLSGGEIKRIEIATMLARSTSLTLFDEPEAGIDIWSFGNLIEVFQKMYDKIQGNILIISHQERILDIADKIVVIANGKVAAYGDKNEIYLDVYDKKENVLFNIKYEDTPTE